MRQRSGNNPAPAPHMIEIWDTLGLDQSTYNNPIRFATGFDVDTMRPHIHVVTARFPSGAQSALGSFDTLEKAQAVAVTLRLLLCP